MRFYVLGCILVLFCLSSMAQEKAPDSVISKAFQYIKNDDEAAYLRLLPSRYQLEKILITLSNSPEVDSAIMASMKNQSEEEYQNGMQPYYLGIFRHLRKIGQQKGINWSTASLDRIVFDSIFSKLLNNERWGTIYFSDSGQQYKLAFNQVYLSPGEGWLGIAFDQLSGKSWDERIEPFEKMISGDSTFEVDVRDVIMTSVEEKEAPPPPPPAKSKKKTVIKETPEKRKD